MAERVWEPFLTEQDREGFGRGVELKIHEMKAARMNSTRPWY